MNHTNFEEYENPALYDQENNNYTPELELLSKWATKSEGPIIDLACGTGRITIQLAQMGYKLMGVDVHQGMLNEAMKKSSMLEVPIDWVLQDCTALNLNQKSKLIYCIGNSFQHFLTNEDQDNLLVSIFNHLEKDGIFIFGTRFPNQEELLQAEDEEYWRTYIDRETLHKVDVYTISSYDSLKQIQHYQTIRRYKNGDGIVVNEKTTNIRLRYVFPKEMERLLSMHGFEIVEVYGDWKETPFTNHSNEMVYVCRKSHKNFLYRS